MGPKAKPATVKKPAAAKKAKDNGTKPSKNGYGATAVAAPSAAQPALSQEALDLFREPVLILSQKTLKIIACNVAASAFYGHTRARLISQPIEELAIPSERATLAKKVHEPTGSRREFHQLRGDGTTVFTEFEPVPITFEGAEAYLCVVHDISASSQLVRSLLESDARNREIIENANDIVYTHDLDGNFTSVNRAVTVLLGYTREEAMRMNMRDILDPEDFQRAADAVRTKVEGKQAAHAYQLNVFTKSREKLTLEVNTRLIHRNGKPVGVQGIARDISERTRVERALRESEAKFRAVADNAPCAIIIYQGSKFRYVNKATRELTGYGSDELLSFENFWDIITPDYREMVKERAAARLRGEFVQARYEFSIHHKAGHIRWMDFTASNIQYEGAPAVVVMVFDVTDRKMREKEVLASEEKYRALFERNLAGVFVSTLEGAIIDCNESFAHIYGYADRAEMLKNSARSLYLTPEHRDGFISQLRSQRAISNQVSCYKRKDGTPFWALENVALLEGMDGEGDRIQGTLVDITERKFAEQALIESETKFRAVADTASSAIYIHNGKKFLYVNRASEEISGYTAKELLLMSPVDVVHPEDRALVMEYARQRQTGGSAPSRYEYRIRAKSGETKWVDFSAGTIQFEGETAILATAFDITERKRVESLQAALYRIADKANSAEDLQEFFKAIHQIIGELMYAKNFYIALLDKASQTVFYPYYVDEADEPPVGSYALGRGLTEYVLRTNQPLLANPEVTERLQSAGEVVQIGTPSVDWLGAPLHYGQESIGVIAVQSYTEDVRYSERERGILNFVAQHISSAVLRKRNEDALRESESRYRSMVESAVYGIYRSSLDGRFLEVNPALVNMLGYDSAEELLSLRMSRSIYANPEERQRLIDAYAHAGKLENVEVQWKRKDHRLITVRLSGRAVMDANDRVQYFEMIVEDVTERRGLEEQLRQSQKMEAIGRLAGGVAHDFNNLLTVIKGYSELMLDELRDADPMRSEVEEIKRAADRAATLTRQLLAFSRQQVLAPKVLDLNGVVGNMDKLLKRLLGEDIALYTTLEANLGRVKADPGQVEQVIMNLAVNARDAMPRGGKLTIETANVELDENYVREHMGARAGSYVMLAVSDNGMGMREEVRQRIFEPFFTTKEQGKGTGLGLSTVYGIVKQSEGYIWVYSEVGIGTSFKVYLPRVDAPAEAPAKTALAPAKHRGNETVLLVEDEDGVRALVRQVLHKHGYTVLEARHGGEALLHCERHSGRIDMLLTDVVLEQMGGPELAARLLAVRPDLRVLYISGYTDDAIVHHGVLTDSAAFLQKPFTTESLAKKIREVLDK